jgi:peptide/nickel transport system substrate-binding protein
MRRTAPLLFALPLALLASCGGTDDARGPVGGTVIIAAAADADAMLPPLVRTSQGRLASELLFDRLVEIGPSLNTIGDADFQPRLAKSWTWSADSLSITFTLHPDATWHDGRPVVAADVEAGYAAIIDTANGSNLLADLADVAGVSSNNDGTVTIQFKRRAPEQFYAASVIFPLPAHLIPTEPGAILATSALARNPVGSGPYRFVQWTPLERFEFAAVEDFYRGRARLDRVVVTITPEPATGLARLWAEEADVWELLPAGDVAEAQRHAHVRLVNSNAFDYSFVAFNFRDATDREKPHPLFADAALRRAISMAVDRPAIVQAIFDTLAIPLKGPFVTSQFTADTSVAQLPFDRTAAAALLDSLGWRVDAKDGMRRRNGKLLTFTALIPGSSRNRERASVLMQEQLRQVGIAMEIERAENRTFTQKRQDGQFDVVFGGWLTTPSPRGLRSTWGTFGDDGWGGQNDGRYSNASFDAAVQSGLAAMDATTARAHFKEAYGIIVNDAAAMFLYEPRTVAVVHKRFRIPKWRPDGWWRSLPEWTVAPDERLPRDLGGARPAAN